jgi:hypothetical protein
MTKQFNPCVKLLSEQHLAFKPIACDALRRADGHLAWLSTVAVASPATRKLLGFWVREVWATIQNLRKTGLRSGGQHIAIHDSRLLSRPVPVAIVAGNAHNRDRTDSDDGSGDHKTMISLRAGGRSGFAAHSSR